MSRLKVLLTNENFNALGGAALYVRDVALGLLRQGHKPVVYSPELGDLARELRKATVPVVDRLEDIAEEPDVIHGQHSLTTLRALLHFSRTPAVFFCHGWDDAPLKFPRILRYVAVDEVCYDSLVSENGIPPERVKLLLNFADLRRFKPRAALPATPKRALVFSNTISEVNGLLALREACSRAGLELDAIGYGTQAAATNPEDLLPAYDLVFGKARCVIEALAVGCAVVVCDVAGMAGMVTSENLSELRQLNFGRRSLINPLDPSLIFDQIKAYDATDAARVTKTIRQKAGLDEALGQLINLYEDVVAEYGSAPPDTAAEMRAAAAQLNLLPSRPDGTDAAAMRTAQRPAAIPSVLADEMVLSLLSSLPLDDIQTASGQLMNAPDETVASSVWLQTPALPWQYATILRLPEPKPEHANRAAVVRVRLRVHRGHAGVGLLDRSDTAFVARQPLTPTHDFVDVFLRVKALDEVGALVFQSWDEPEDALIEVQAVDLYLVGTT